MRVLKVNGYVFEHYEQRGVVKIFKEGKRPQGLTLPMGPGDELVKKIKEHFKDSSK